jgi:hypothetical protein
MDTMWTKQSLTSSLYEFGAFPVATILCRKLLTAFDEILLDRTDEIVLKHAFAYSYLLV